MPVEESEKKIAFHIDDFLAAEADKDLLRFSTAGSVDDGKSTLIGRLLYDSRNVYEDHVRAVTGTQVGDRQPTIDFALLTDGLRAEREQGITIDVAYRYFSTQHRKFIIADTPGHEQYTRNMATGASTADLAIILVDARKGVQVQSRRHAYIASLLGIQHLVVAINKMDLVDFSQEIYNQLANQFREIVQSFGTATLQTIPISALEGDNVVERSSRTPWYNGPTLLDHLERVPVWTDQREKPFRLAVQRVIRPDQNFRGFAGQISAGTIRKGQAMIALPSGRTSSIASISTFDGELQEASAPLSITVTLNDELDISRGDLLADPAQLPHPATAIEASLVWFDAERLETHRPYLLKSGPQVLPARITRVHHRTNIQTLADEAVNSLQMNDIGVVDVELTRPLHFDPYVQNRATGSFILIDPQRNATLAAGMILRAVSSSHQPTRHRPALLYYTTRKEAALSIDEVESLLLQAGADSVRTSVTKESTLRGLLALGLVVIVDDPAHLLSHDALQVDRLAVINLNDFATSEELLNYLRKNVLPAVDEGEAN